jgi:type IV pilus assembly protein PilW
LKTPMSKHRSHVKKHAIYVKQKGLTLVELMVAMGLGLLVILIATAALMLSRQGYDAVDATSQLRERQRLAIDMLTRVIVQTGFEDFGAASTTFRANADASSVEPDIFGWNNAVYKTFSGGQVSAVTAITNESRPGACASVTDTSCKNGSDILAVRYQGVGSPTNLSNADNSMVNCGGAGDRGLITNDLDRRSASIFFVDRAPDGEPGLYCTYFDTSGNWASKVALIEGVEAFQVLYGTDGVTPATVPALNDPAQDTIAERWLRADQLTVASNPLATRNNWRRVRAVRVGLVLRGPVGSAPQSVTSTLQPLGSAFTNSSNDIGSALTVSADRRLRSTETFTVHIRNDLTLR